jgi:hypothetical protein
MGLKASEFARQQLDRLELGRKLIGARALWQRNLLPASGDDRDLSQPGRTLN